MGRPGGQKLERTRLRGKFFCYRWLFLLVFGLIVLALVGYTWAEKKVYLIVDGQETQVTTFGRTVAEVLKARGVTFSPQDQITPPLSTPLQDDLRIVVNHAVQVTLEVDGQVRDLQTCQKTVGDLLKEQGIPVNAEDIVEPGVASRITEGTKIKVVRVQSEEEIKEVSIPCPTRREADPHLAVGFQRVVQAGRDGLEKQRWQVVYHDGQEVERRLVERSLLKEPVERVIRVGALRQVSRSGQDIRFSRALDVIATAYTYTGNNTASGIPPHFGAVAVDPQVIPLGSRLYVEGYGFARALDTGSAIKGNRIDVFFETREQTRRWGVRRVRVYVLE